VFNHPLLFLEVSMDKIVWEQVREAYLHGERATLGDRMAEVVRAYEGEWYWFPWLDGRQVVTGKDASILTKEEAKKRATEYLRNGTINP
jgi:hypothetical protein